MQGGQAGAFEFVEHQHHALDVRILGGRVQNGQDVAQLGSWRVLPAHLLQGGRAQVVGLLLDDQALQVEHQRGLVGQGWRAAFDQGDHDHGDQRQKYQIEGQAAAGIQQTPKFSEP